MADDLVERLRAGIMAAETERAAAVAALGDAKAEAERWRKACDDANPWTSEIVQAATDPLRAEVVAAKAEAAAANEREREAWDGQYGACAEAAALRDALEAFAKSSPWEGNREMLHEKRRWVCRWCEVETLPNWAAAKQRDHHETCIWAAAGGPLKERPHDNDAIPPQNDAFDWGNKGGRESSDDT